MTLVSLLLFGCSITLRAQLAQVLPQQALKQWHIPAGNYSGITPLGKEVYAVVSDKAPQLGYFVWRIAQDSATGQIAHVENLGFRALQQLPSSAPLPLDVEDLMFDGATHQMWIANEGNQTLTAFDTLSRTSVKELEIPTMFSVDSVYSNLGFEALAHDFKRDLWYSTSESPLRADAPARPEQLPPNASLPLRLAVWNGAGQLTEVWSYDMAKAQLTRSSRYYLHGVPALCVLPNGNLLVMERELSVPRAYLGAKCNIRLRLISRDNPSIVREVASWRTRLSLFARSFANYEGMCLGIRLRDGRQTLLCVSDAQGGAGRFGVHLRDFLRVVVLDHSLTD